MASALLRNPEAREKHFQRCSASATMSILYDYPTLETEDDKTLKEIHAFNDRASEASAPGAHLVEVFPWMMYIPDRSVLTLIDGFSPVSPETVSALPSGNVKANSISSNTRECSRRFLTTFVTKM